MFIYILEQNDKIKIGKTINPKQRLTKLEKEWGNFYAPSTFFKFSIDKLKENNLTIDNIEKTIHRLLKLKGIYINDLDKKDGYKEFFKKTNDIDIFQLFYDNFSYYIEKEYSLNELDFIKNDNLNNFDYTSYNKETNFNIHNDLISAKHNWSTNEIKIILNSLAKINLKKELVFKYSKKEILNLLDNINYSSRDLKDISNRLMSKKFEINDNNHWIILNWFSKINYNEGFFIIEYNHNMKQYLLDLKNNFTKFNIKNILSMKSNYSIRIYQLLKQYEKNGYRTFSIEDLRNILKIPTSYSYAIIKRNIINQSQEEMSQYSDITFDFEEIKTGRKITDIKFIINKK